MNAINISELATGAIAKQFLFSDLRQYSHDLVELTQEQIMLASNSILKLSDYYLSILFFKYVFNLYAEDAKIVLESPNPKDELNFVRYLISRSIGLPEHTLVGDLSLSQATNIAYEKYVELIENDPTIVDINSHLNERLEKKISKALQINIIPIHRLILIWGKRAAVIFVAILTTFVTTLTVSAELRSKFFGWVVERFPVFSQVIPVNAPSNPFDNDTDRIKKLLNATPSYIPDNFSLDYSIDAPPFSKTIFYTTKDNKKITFKCERFIDSYRAIARTEDAIMIDIEINGEPGILWELDDVAWCMWQEDGILFTIYGNTDLEEIIKMANSIKK